MSTKVKTKKSKTKHKSKKLIVPKWKLFRASEPILSVFMWGVNHSVSRCCFFFDLDVLLDPVPSDKIVGIGSAVFDGCILLPCAAVGGS